MCGSLRDERLWLNDVSAWSGMSGADPLHGVVDRGPVALAAVRTAIDAEEIAAAERLLMRIQAPWVQVFLPLGWIDMDVDAAAP